MLSPWAYNDILQANIYIITMLRIPAIKKAGVSVHRSGDNSTMYLVI